MGQFRDVIEIPSDDESDEECVSYLKVQSYSIRPNLLLG